TLVVDCPSEGRRAVATEGDIVQYGAAANDGDRAAICRVPGDDTVRCQVASVPAERDVGQHGIAVAVVLHRTADVVVGRVAAERNAGQDWTALAAGSIVVQGAALIDDHVVLERYVRKMRTADAAEVAVVIQAASVN